MFICPICRKEFTQESEMSKHLLVCWKQHNPNHKSNPAPHSEDIVTRNVSASIADFFNQGKE